MNQKRIEHRSNSGDGEIKIEDFSVQGKWKESYDQEILISHTCHETSEIDGLKDNVIIRLSFLFQNSDQSSVKKMTTKLEALSRTTPISIGYNNATYGTRYFRDIEWDDSKCELHLTFGNRWR